MDILYNTQTKLALLSFNFRLAVVPTPYVLSRPQCEVPAAPSDAYAYVRAIIYTYTHIARYNIIYRDCDSFASDLTSGQLSL